MNDWAPRRFWKAAGFVPAEGGEGFAVHLDGRPLKTPAKLPLVLPTEDLAALVADEWNAQGERVDPATMPATRTANSVLDRVIPERAAVADLIADYGESDLICYRAEAPDALVARQAAAWDPLIAWAGDTLGAPLNVGTGVMHVAQPPESVAALRARVHALSPWQLAAFHDLVALSGSLVIGFAALRDYAPAEMLWELSRIDEDWQAEHWGADEEAAETAEWKCRGFLEAARFCRLV